MSLLWVQAVGMESEQVEHVPVSSLVDQSYLRAWGHRDHPAMADLLERLRGDGGYDPARHGMLRARVRSDGQMGMPSLPREHALPGFGDNSGAAMAIALHHLGHEHVPVAVTRPRGAESKQWGEALYHGTTMRGDLQQIRPLREHGSDDRVSNSNPNYAYATHDPNDAWYWAQEAWHKNPVGVPRVFRVRPRGPVEPDPNFAHHDNPAQVRSRHGFDVVGEEPMPHDIRHLFQDDD